MLRLFNSVAFRLAMVYGGLVVGAVALISVVLYFGTVGVLDGKINSALFVVSDRLTHLFEIRGEAALQQEIEQLLRDGIDQDTEVYLLLRPNGETIVGNISRWTDAKLPSHRLTDQIVTRYGRQSNSRLLPSELPNGCELIAGRDMQDIQEIEQLVLHALVLGTAAAVLLAIAGAFLFRRQLENRIAGIRRMVLEIKAGNLARRIPPSDADDEFTRLNRDLNQMLDQTQLLMDGVRDVSNAIAHDLRTPLSRIRSLLEEALRPGTSEEGLCDRASSAIRAIDDLIIVFDKLLQIAEAESGTRRRSFRLVALKEIVRDVVELYDASAEVKGIRLTSAVEGEPTAIGDKDLLASATANLVDNALKYACCSATVQVRAMQGRNTVSIVVQDAGPGIPSGERSKVITRFYRLDRSRSLPGNGLGLPIVRAISNLHSGSLSLEDAGPGLIARIDLPRVSDSADLEFSAVLVNETSECK